MKRVLLVLLPLLLACRGPKVYLAPGVPFRIRPATEGPALFVNQEVQFTLPGGRMETALATLENKDGRFVVVAGTPMGQTFLVVTVTGAEVEVDARMAIPGDLDPRALAALIQFCVWPAEDVRKGLTDPQTTLVEEGARRTLLRKGKPVWIATHEGDTPPYKLVILENPSLRLRVQIRTLEE